MIDFLRLAAGVAVDTVAYLLAWWAVPLWALAGAVVLQRLAGAFLLAVARPFGREEVRGNLQRLDGRPGATAVYLTAGHGLTLYYFALLGPLLGKDVLLSHVLGMVAFAGFAAAFAVLLRAGGSHRPAGPPNREGSGPGGDAAAGLLAAPATFMWPVATLFAGTFLWKVGLAHAGLVAFFCAATLSPQRVRLYREVWGRRRTVRWVAALALAALAAGLAVAVLFGLSGLEIRYKLVPEQLWSP